MDKSKPKQDRKQYWKEQTTQYNLRFINATGVPLAIEHASKATGRTSAEYMKGAIVQMLREDGFLHGEVVLNQNKQRHREKIARLKEYIAQEERKMK